MTAEPLVATIEAERYAQALGGSMAMIKCPECGHDFSTLAAACPSCGAPLGARAVAAPVASTQPAVRLPFKIAAGAVGILMVIAVIFGVLNKPQPHPESAMSVTIEELQEAYAQNTVAADAQFKGRNLALTSAVQNINTDIAGGAYLVLGRPDQILAPQASIADSDRGQAASLRPGNVVRLLCVGAGDLAKTPMLSDCHFQAEATVGAKPVPQAAEQTPKGGDVYTFEYIQRPDINARLHALLGNKYADLEADATGPANAMQMQGDYWTGSVCRAHACGSDGVFIANNVNSDQLVVAIWKGGKSMDVYGVRDSASIPAPVSDWIKQQQAAAQ